MIIDLRFKSVWTRICEGQNDTQAVAEIILILFGG